MTITWPALHPTFASDTVISLGVIWTFGGSVDGKGRFIKDAEAYVKVGSVTATYSFDVTAKFAESGTPIGSEPVAMLTGTFNVVRSRTIFGGRRLLGLRVQDPRRRLRRDGRALTSAPHLIPITHFTENLMPDVTDGSRSPEASPRRCSTPSTSCTAPSRRS